MSSGDRIRRRGAQSQSINAGSDGSNVVTEGSGTPEAGQTTRTGSAARVGESNTTGASRTLTDAQNQVGDRGTTTAAHSSVASFQNGVVTTTAGSRFDMTTARGVIEAQAELGANFTALQGTLEAQGFRLDAASGSWVPADAVDRAGNPNKFTGHLSAELRDGDQEIIKAMAERGFPNLVNKETAAGTLQKLTSAQYRAGFDQAVDAVRAAIANPNAAMVGRAADYINQLSTQIGANAMEILFFVFRESIQATNEDKKYFLERLQDYNLMAEKLSDYLSQLVDDSQRLSAAAAGAKYPEKVTISIEVQKFDLSTLGSDGKVASMAGYPMSKTVDRAGLNDTIKDVESMQETVRNKRQMASTAFQNFDQKANQLYNLMASVLKVMNEMRSSTTRNML